MKHSIEDILRAVEEAGGNKAAAARKLGIPSSTLKSRLSNLSLPEEQNIHILKEGYENKIKGLRDTIKGLSRTALTTNSVRKAIWELADYSPTPPEWLSHTPAGDFPGVPIVMWSDWHWGEVVKKEEVGGVNEFNIEIARQRFRALVDRTLHLCFDHVSNPNYPGVVVVIGGDMVCGLIHDELAETSEGYVMEHVFDLLDHLSAAIEKLANEFGKVYIPWTYGNHGRLHEKQRYKGSALNNFDWQLGCMLARHFKEDKRVQFSIPNGPDTPFMVYSHSYLLTHGDRLGVRGGDGAVGIVGPITRGVQKLKAGYAMQGTKIDTVLMGHHHNYMVLPNDAGLVNNCLKGYDEYAMGNRFLPDVPSQAIFWHHPRYGMTFRGKIYVDNRDEALVIDRPWVSWREQDSRPIGRG